LKRLDPFGLDASFGFEPDGGNGWAEVLLAAFSAQPQEVSRSEAIRRLVELGLKAKAPK